MKISEIKKIRYWVVLGVFLYGFIEALSFGALQFLQTRRISYSPFLSTSLSDKHREYLTEFLESTTSYLAYSPQLGWTVRENSHNRLFRSNSQGIRAEKEYSLIPPSDIVRIACFGDSYTHGNEVSNKETWEEALMRIGSGIEVLNFGVPAYGLDQAFLRYQYEGAQYKPQIVFIGFMTENIARHITVFRPFYYPPAAVPLSKPRFLLRDGILELYENPIQQFSQYRDLLAEPQRILPILGINDYYYRYAYKQEEWDLLPSVRLMKMMSYKLRYRLIGSDGEYRENTEAFQVTQRLFDTFYETVIRQGSLPIILLFPEIFDFPVSQKTKPYDPLLRYFAMKKYEYIDLATAFEKHGGTFTLNELFMKGNHYSSLGNEIVAEYLWDYLQEHKLMDYQILQERVREVTLHRRET